MTNKENVKWLESLKKEIGKAENRTLWHYAEAIDMAIEALKQTEQIGCTGCEHYDQQQTALICRDCKRYYRDMYEDGDKVTVMEKDKI